MGAPGFRATAKSVTSVTAKSETCRTRLESPYNLNLYLHQALECDFTPIQMVWYNALIQLNSESCDIKKVSRLNFSFLSPGLSTELDSLLTQQQHLNIDDRARGNRADEALQMF